MKHLKHLIFVLEEKKNKNERTMIKSQPFRPPHVFQNVWKSCFGNETSSHLIQSWQVLTESHA